MASVIHAGGIARPWHGSCKKFIGTAVMGCAMSSLDIAFTAKIARFFAETAGYWAMLGFAYPWQLPSEWRAERQDDQHVIENLFWD